MLNAASPPLDQRQNVGWREGQFADIAANCARDSAGDGCADVQDWHFDRAFARNGYQSTQATYRNPTAFIKQAGVSHVENPGQPDVS